MPFRPTGYTSWAAGATNIAEPTDAKKTVGWAINEQPPSSYFNWIQQKSDAWRDYLDWITQMEDVIDESWNYAAPDDATANFYLRPSGLKPLWDVSGSYIGAPFYGALSMGNFDGAGTASHTAFVRKAANRPRSNEDWILDATFYLTPGYVATNHMIAGFATHLAFYVTGTSGYVGLHYRPSGKTPTAIGMSAGAFANFPSGVKFTVAARGPTMVLERDGVQLYALPYQPLGDTGGYNDTFTLNVRAAHQINPGAVTFGPVRYRRKPR